MPAKPPPGPFEHQDIRVKLPFGYKVNMVSAFRGDSHYMCEFERIEPAAAPCTCHGLATDITKLGERIELVLGALDDPRNELAARVPAHERIDNVIKSVKDLQDAVAGLDRRLGSSVAFKKLADLQVAVHGSDYEHKIGLTERIGNVQDRVSAMEQELARIEQLLTEPKPRSEAEWAVQGLTQRHEKMNDTIMQMMKFLGMAMDNGKVILRNEGTMGVPESCKVARKSIGWIVSIPNPPDGAGLAGVFWYKTREEAYARHGGTPRASIVEVFEGDRQ